MTILQWPLELIEMVLANLHPLNVVKLRCVCKTLRDIIDSSNEIQLHLGLAEDGHLLKNRQKEPIFVLKERFNSHRRALNGFHTRSLFDATIEGFHPDRYDISDGVICRLMNSQNHSSISRIVYNELDCVEGKEGWTHFWETDMKIIDLSFWASSDVQILTEDKEPGVCKRLHFLSISNNSPHPLAVDPHMDLRESDAPISNASFTLMHEDKVAMVFQTDSDKEGRVFAFDWKTGKIILNYRNASDATFAPNGYLLLALKATQNDLRPGFEVFSLPSEEHLYRCLLPFDALVGISIISNHNFDYPRNPFTSMPRDFIPDPDLNIIGAKLEWEIDDDDEESKTIVVSIKTMLDICSSVEDHQTIEWKDWGPRSTRFLPSSLEAAGDICIFGSRMVACEAAGSSAENDLFILDFNPHNLEREKLLQGAENVYDSASKFTFDLKGAQSLEVTSSLPFRKLIAKDSFFYNVDLDGMILIIRDETNEDDMVILKLCPPEENS